MSASLTDVLGSQSGNLSSSARLRDSSYKKMFKTEVRPNLAVLVNITVFISSAGNWF